MSNRRVDVNHETRSIRAPFLLPQFVIGVPSLPHWYMADHGDIVLVTFPGHAQLGLQQSSIVVVL
jgi:hypothetical protein